MREGASECNNYDKSLSVVDCVQGYEYTLYSFLILLEIPPNDEHAVAFATCCHLLHAPDPLEPLHGPALGEDDKDLEAVADLPEARKVSHWVQVTCQPADAPRCDAQSRL